MTSTSSSEEGSPGSHHTLKVLGDRIGDLEELVHEAIAEIGKLRKQVAELKTVVAKKKQLKKLKKVLDQLEVIEVGDGAPDGALEGPRSQDRGKGPAGAVSPSSDDKKAD